jgi:uncharacterized protein YndB with AHSA1/START domain
VGGRIYEVDSEGTEHTWGTVTSIDVPHRIEYSWHPGRPPEEAQTIQVRFEPRGNSTLVTLTHTGWEVLGERAESVRGSYLTGWDLVFGQRYGGAAGEA